MPGDIPIEALFAPFFVLSVAIEWWSVKTGRANGRYETADAITSSRIVKPPRAAWLPIRDPP